MSSAEVAALTAQKQQNVFPRTNSRRVAEIFAENVFSIFNLIVAVIVGALLFFWFRTGDARLPLDAVGVLAIAVINTTLAIVQEIEQTAIVKGDLIKLTRGDQIAVDGLIVEVNHLEIDESLLIGESVPIEKRAGDAVLSGSFCSAGNGFYLAEKENFNYRF